MSVSVKCKVKREHRKEEKDFNLDDYIKKVSESVSSLYSYVHYHFFECVV